MTREEAITLIKSALKTMYLPKSKEYISDLGYALEMAIKALEQEPCEDCISREQLKHIADLINDINLKETIRTELWQEMTRTELWQEIRGLSIDKIEELMWGWYRFIIDIYDMMNM